MSWSVGYSSTKALTENKANDPLPEMSVEALEQLALAKTLALQIVSSGAIGDASGNFGFGFNGHANPSHQLANGRMNDHLTIAVTAITTPQLATI